MLDIHVLLAVVPADDAEGLALAYVQRCLVEDRTADDVFATGWLYLIETYGRKNVPCRHLTYVLIAAQSVEIVLIHLVHGLAEQTGTLPRLTYIVVHVEHLMARFIAVSILTDEA